MANKSFFDTLTQYRLKVEKDGKPVVNVPTIFALPGLLVAPKLSIAGLIAAPLLGLKVRLENEDGKEVDVEGAVRDVVDTVKETATTAAKTIKEEMDKAWESVSADDPEPDDTADETADAGETAQDIEEIEEDLKAHGEDGIPTIEVKPDDSDR